MPAKYSIHTKPAAPRVRPVGKLGIIDWREDCSSCHNCVKRDCVYGLYRDEADTLRDEIGYLDYIYQCKGCLNCIQNCTKGILTRVVNPEFKRLGDDYYTPEIILSTWFQSESGRIPVSGSGYGGPFSGQGFDSMWTDMSEIVRPTRDGIHGREYISTSVDIGRKLKHLAFRDGQLDVASPPLVEIPMPVIFDIIPQHWQRGPVLAAVVRAAAELGTLAVVRQKDITAELAGEQSHIIPLLDEPFISQQWARLTAALVPGAGLPTPGTSAGVKQAHGDGLERPSYTGASMVMLPDGDNVMAAVAAIKQQNPDQIVAIRIAATPAVAARAVALARAGAEVLHLVFDAHGRESGSDAPRHVRDVLRDVHGSLVKDGTRDQVTLVSSGGIAQAEHVAKAILCGADLVAIDLPLLIAMECRLCRECEQGRPCVIALDDLELGYAAHRAVNLMGAWHQQLIEVLGAMGIREVRRLRGETGRAMFFEDLERDSFGRLFGKRKDHNGAKAT